MAARRHFFGSEHPSDAGTAMAMLWSSEAGLSLTDGEALVHIAPHGRCVACVSHAAVHFWSLGSQPTLVAVCGIPNALRQRARHHRLAWHPGGRCIAVASGDHVLFYSVAKSTQVEEPYASPSVTTHSGQATCICADGSGVLVGGGGPASDSAATLALLSWDGLILRTFRTSSGHASPLLDSLPPLIAVNSSSAFGGTLCSPNGAAPLPASLHRTPSCSASSPRRPAPSVCSAAPCHRGRWRRPAGAPRRPLRGHCVGLPC